MRTLLFAVFLGSLTTAFGNGGGYVFGTPSNGSLSAFQPKNAQQIEMQTEDLQIDLHLEFGRVQVEYTLHNPGKAVTAEIGFPCKAATDLVEDENGKKKEGEVAPPLRDFTALLDKERLDVKVTREKTGQKDFPAPEVRGEASPFRQVPYWYTFKLNFEAGQTRKLRVSYDTNYHAVSGSVSEDAETTPETLTYLFSTAAVWKGAIKEGKVTIRAVGVPADQVKLNLAKRFKRDGSQWTWEFKDFEPTLADDLNIVAHPKNVSFGRPLPGANVLEGTDVPYADFVQVDGKWSLHHRDFAAVASSFLPGQGDNVYTVESLADLNNETAWVEGSDGDGIGEKLGLKLNTPRKVSHLGIRNGYCKSETSYRNNGRIAELSIAVNDSEPFTVTIPDERLERHNFEIPLPGTPEVKTLTLTIKKVYPGAKHSDTAISELELVTPLEKAPKITPAR